MKKINTNNLVQELYQRLRFQIKFNSNSKFIQTKEAGATFRVNELLMEFPSWGLWGSFFLGNAEIWKEIKPFCT